MSEELNTKSQELAMIIIANSGEAKGLAFNALKVMREEKDLSKALGILEEANKHITEAHLSQTQLLVMSAAEEGVKVDVLLVHAQDHLMTTMMATELIEEMIHMMDQR